MNKKSPGLLWLALGTALAACELDNYEAPATTLQGRIVYNGEPINVEKSNRSIENANVYFELWEPGWQTKQPIRVIVAQDGSYSARLFNATYKLVIPPGQGPFRSRINEETNSDTIVVNLSGSQTLDIEVIPYYMVRDPQFLVSGRTVSASCRLESIITGANAKGVERVSLYLSRTQFVDGQSGLPTKDLNGGDIRNLNQVSLSVDVPAFTPSQNYVFARIGIKIRDVDDLLFSPVQKIDLP